MLLHIMTVFGLVALNYYVYLCLQELRTMNGKQGTPK